MIQKIPPFYPLAIANKVVNIHLAAENKQVLSADKLMAMLFLIHGYHFALYNSSAFVGHFRAYPFGPATIDIAEYLNGSDLTSIIDYYFFYRINTDGGIQDIAPQLATESYCCKLVQDVYSKCISLSGRILTNHVVQPGTPWNNTYASFGQSRIPKTIDDLEILDYFRSSVMDDRLKTKT